MHGRHDLLVRKGGRRRPMSRGHGGERSAAERLLFDRPLLYRAKRFLIERVIWDFLLTGIFRLEPRPMPAALSGLAGQRVLLAACGPGTATTGPAVDEAASVVAFDLSPHFAASCAAHRPDWQVYCGDLLHLPHGPGAFDAAVLYSSLHHVPADARQVLGELSRVAGGRVFVLEGVVPERGLLRRLLLLWYRLVDGGHHYYTLTELRGALEATGLRVAREDLHGPIQHMWLAELAPAHRAPSGAPHA